MGPERFSFPEQEKQIEQVDLMKQISLFSDEERKQILHHSIGLPLEVGCIKPCFFCYKGTKKGIKSEFTPESTISFLDTYGHEFDKNWFLSLYDKSDPIHRSDLNQIYEALRKQQSEMLIVLSTIIPEGYDNNFKKFFKLLVEENNWEKISFRISKFTQNKKRVEENIKELESEFGPEMVKNIIIDTRNKDNTWQLKNQNTEKNIWSPSCSDGVIISPEGIFGLVMVTPTIYDQTGERYIKLEPGKAKKQIPYRSIRNDYIFIENKDHFEKKKNRTYNMLGPLINSLGDEYEIQNNEEETQILTLSREILSFSYSLQEIQELPKYIEEYELNISEVDNYVNNILNEGMERIEKIIFEIFNKTENIETEKMNYYKKLAKLYVTKWMIAVNYREKGADIKQMSKLALYLNDSDQKEIDSFVNQKN